MLASPIPRKKNLATPVLEYFEFISNETELPLNLSIRLNAQILCENFSTFRTLPSLEILDTPISTDTENGLLTTMLIEVLEDIPLVQSEAKVFSPTALEIENVNVVTNGNLKAEPKIYGLIIGTKLLENKQVCLHIFYCSVKNPLLNLDCMVVDTIFLLFPGFPRVHKYVPLYICKIIVPFTNSLSLITH